MDLIPSVQRMLQEYGGRIGGRRLIAGISGGADSVALLQAFHALDIPCTAAHLNHQLRGDAADGDEAFVRALAEQLGIPLKVKRVDVGQLARQTGSSIEMAARQARHEFFAEFGDAVIALAHHADDQIETFILKLARGAGPEGLSGMPVFQQLDGLTIFRPLLDLRRPDILRWLETNRTAWREDASNADESFLRNRVRHTVLPMLQNELNPQIGGAILRTMEILRAENEFIDEASGFAVHGTKLDASSTMEQPCAIRRRIIRKWLFQQGAETASFETVDKILKLMAGGKGTSVHELNDRQRVVVEYGVPRFEQDAFRASGPSWRLTTEPSTGWVRDDSRIGDAAAEASVSAEKLDGRALAVRTVQPGDRMAPLGMAGTRKLQDILTDLKIPKMRRPELPVVVCGAEIVWLPGYRIARGWEAAGQSAASVHIKLEQNRTA